MGRIIALAAALTLAVITVTQVASYATWGGMDGGYEASIVVAGILIPLATCFPISMVLLLQRRRLADALAALEVAHLRLQERSSRDPMTGLLHRQAFFERLSACGRAGSFLMIDVDHFKSINDTSGHAAGDDALRLIARTLTDVADGAAVVTRLGGEEFCVFLQGADAWAGEKLAEQIRRRIGNLEFALKGVQRRLTVSIGVATSAAGGNAEAAIGEADVALYQAKGQGRNRVVVFRKPASQDDDLRSVA